MAFHDASRYYLSMDVKLKIEKDPKEVKWVIRVNGVAVGDCKTEFMAQWMAGVVEKTLNAVGIKPTKEIV